jgi:hypothetical protein
MKSIIRLLVPFVAFAVFSLTSGKASAAYDFVCWVRVTPGSSTMGSNGYLTVSLYTQADCAGSFVGSYNLCSAGATSGGCASSTTYRYSEAALHAHLIALRAALEVDQPDSIIAIPCIVTGNMTCAGNVYYERKP